MDRTTPTPGDTRAALATTPGSGLLDYETAAPVLNCSPRMIRKLVETRKIDSVKVGRLVRIEPAAIDRYIERNRRLAS
jgi:excisionase family DNA binding protein